MQQWPPVTMATQHPDNASVPWWGKDAFIATQDEIQEVMLLFKELTIDEYMWDWEGKYVDEAVGEKLFSRGQELFSKRALGRELHLTYRIPAYEDGKMHRMARAFMNVLALADLARDIKAPCLPVTEMFLPLTTAAMQPLKVRAAFKEILGYHRQVFHRSKQDETELLRMFDVTPLVEDVPSLLSIEKILLPYWTSLITENPSVQSRGQRIFLARSDPAMNSGLVPAVLAVKAALSKIQDCADTVGIEAYPLLGTGSLPFRGSVNPQYTDTFLQQYAGVRTYSIQSAFRYDYPKEQVEKALRIIHREAPMQKLVPVSDADRKKIITLSALFENIWQPTIEEIAPLINQVAAYIPPRRERLQHIGLFGYSRGIGKVRLPRAIGFTCALYSLGIPPELIATGRGLEETQRAGLMDSIEKYYPALRADLMHAGKYLNRENIELLAKRMPIFQDISHGVDAIERILGLKLGPQKPHHFIHRNLSSTILHRLQSPSPDLAILTRDIVEAGIIRKSLG